MKKSYVLAALALVLISILLILRQLRDSGNGDAGRSARSPRHESSSAHRKGRHEGRGRKSSATSSNATVGHATHSGKLLASQWVESPKKLTGHALEQNYYRILNEARKLLKGKEYGIFLEAVYLQGNENYWMIAMLDPFPLGDASTLSEAVDWFGKIENTKFKHKIANKLGRYMTSDQLQHSMALSQSPKTKEMLLAGHCSELAKTRPIDAVKLFKELKPRNVSFESIAYLTGTMPDDTDFQAISALFPSDKYSTARLVRGSLLQRWSRTEPESAATYIKNNPNLVGEDQLTKVMDIWYQKDQSAPDEWVNNLLPSKLKDVGVSMIAKRELRKSHSQAWSIALTIDDFHIKDTALKEIYRDWLEHDPESANTARKDYMNQFPTEEK